MSPALINKGKILFIPICSQGHVNFCITISKKFLEKYSEFADIYFAIDLDFKNKLEKICDKVNYIVYDPPKWTENNPDKPDGNWIVEMIQQFGKCWSENALQYNSDSIHVLKQAFNSLKLSYPALTEIINELKPDFLIFDQLFTVPIGIDQNIPYANLFSTAMNWTGLSKVMPPPGSGLPSIKTPENVKKWEEFIEKAFKIDQFLQLHDSVNQFLHEKNSPVNLDDQYFVFAPSKYLNIYCYPKELDFKEDFPNDFPHKWMRIDSPVLKPYPEPYAMPEKLKNKPGKLIYFSLGSMASSYKPLMNKMLDVLSKTNHRYIVSTGLIGEEYKLSDNMHGEKYVNQFAVLQTAEMIISHGGNNTLTESFHFGVPLIFVPLFGDQMDNAQRVQDKGYGVRCNIHAPPEVLKQQLEDGIEYCSRESVKLKMKKISERIQQNSGIDDICDELLKYVKK